LIVVPWQIADEVAAHAAGMYAGYESTGALILRDADGRVVRYDRLPNRSHLKGQADFGGEVWLPRGCRRVLTHSHPSGPALPSAVRTPASRSARLNAVGRSTLASRSSSSTSSSSATKPASRSASSPGRSARTEGPSRSGSTMPASTPRPSASEEDRRAMRFHG